LWNRPEILVSENGARCQKKEEVLFSQI
jgi:hypothetical protein